MGRTIILRILIIWIILFQVSALFGQDLVYNEVADVLSLTSADLLTVDTEKEAYNYEETVLTLAKFIRLYQLEPSMRILRQGKSLVDNYTGNQDDLTQVLFGIIEAYIARERKAFGMKNLEKMEQHFYSISEDPDPLVLFLRGMTLYELTLGLPDIGPLKEKIATAENTALEDFQELEKQAFLPEDFHQAYQPYLLSLSEKIRS